MKSKLKRPIGTTSFRSTLEVLHQDIEEPTTISFKKRFPHLHRIIEKDAKNPHLPLVESIKRKCPIMEQNSRDKTLYNLVIKEILDQEIAVKQRMFKGEYNLSRPSQKDFDKAQQKIKQLSRKLEIQKVVVAADKDDFTKNEHQSSVFQKFSQYKRHSEYELLQQQYNLEDSLKLLDKIYKD